MADNNYATKQDLAVLKRNVAELHAHADERFDQSIEATREMQAEVLRAFRNQASLTYIKIRSHEYQDPLPRRTPP